MQKLFHNPHAAVLLCGIVAVLVIVLVWQALLDRSAVPAERMRNVLERKSELRQAQRKKLSRRAGLQRLGAMKQVVNWFKLARGKGFQDLRIKLARAGYRSRDAMFVFIFLKLILMAGLAFGASFLLFVLHLTAMTAGLRILVVLFLALIGWSMPGVFIKNLAQKREDILRKSMPDALDLLVICAEAGLSLNAGLDRVSREIGQTAPELAEEVSLTAVELNFLPDRAKALQGLSDRVPLPGVIALVNTLVQTEKYGTPLAQALRVLSMEMREERIMKAEEKAARLPAILTVPMILFILPPLFVVLVGPAAIKVSQALSGIH